MRARSCGVQLAEAPLETPEVLEMLARPQQRERRVDRCLVATAGSFTHTRQKPAAALGVADVRRRHRAVVHERVPQCDVPGLERMELAVEVLTASLESRAAISHSCERP